MRNICFISLLSILVSCGGNGGGGNSSDLSSGLKIFVTSESHVGNFSEDPLLTGSNSIEKLDDFCASSSSRPDDSLYKALIVDGINRDAVSLTNWVLQPNTTYYRPYDDIEIGTTDNLAIFPVLFSHLTNSIAERTTATVNVWTGIGDVLDFSAGDTCNLWSDHTSSFIGVLGLPHEVDRAAFNPVNIAGATCVSELQVYCVEQP